MALFQSAVLNKYLKEQDSTRIAEAYAAFTKHFHDPAIQANIRDSKEEQYQEGFLRDLFVNVLGYTLNPQKGFELTTEFKNEKGAKKADGAILENGKALAVIELKGTDTTDLQTINAQAFNYKANHSHCVYVVTSNFHKLRFFIDNAVEHIEFDLFTLNAADFRLLWLCLQRDNLLGGIPKKVKAESLQEEEKVTKRLYKDYSTFKNALWQNLCTNHPEHDKLLLYKKSQKLLDRFLFVLFSEDKGLLPPNSIREIADQWEKLKDLDAYVPLYDRFQKYFGYLNTGHKGKLHDIFAYNGGLFRPDELLDNVRISDEVLHLHLLTISKYDFASEVDVNILGHIFEHSLNDIENITAQLEGRAVDAKKTKRKKDGVFYTPKYITQYIVEHTVGRLCTEKKDELAMVDEEYAKGRKGRQKKTIEALLTKLDVYRDWLLALTICDPACGSGAFLNQALDFLIAEHQYVNELESQVRGESIVFKDIGDHILERNIYGVDINEESVEIARLSLWLRTATKGRKLNDLSSNIKCGNSLIDDPAVAGDKAFNWEKEFPRVFEKGGFDVVIGNPPYVQLSKIASTTPAEKSFLLAKYGTSGGRLNTYIFFIHLGIELARQDGFESYIIPNTLLTQEYYQETRRIMLSQSSIEAIVSYPYMPFAEAVVENITFISRKRITPKGEAQIVQQTPDAVTVQKRVPHTKFLAAHQQVFDIRDNDIATRIETTKAKPLSHYVEINQAIALKGDKSISVKSEPVEGYYRLIDGKHINRYRIAWGGDYLDYDLESIHSCKRKDIFETKEKLFFRRVSERLIFTYDNEQYFALNTLIVVNLKEGIAVSIKALLAVLNSTLMNYYYAAKYKSTKKVFSEIQTRTVKLLPICNGIVEQDEELARLAEAQMKNSKLLDDCQELLTTLLQSKYTLPKLSRNLENWPALDFKGFLKELKKALASAKATNGAKKVTLTLAEEAEWLGYFTEQQAKAHALQAEIDKTDAAIDALVYQLYGLTEEEVKVVEGKA
jgi:type I restriction-modification system DNA methylase subunit